MNWTKRPGFFAWIVYCTALFTTPVNTGSFPTYAEDDDPLDALVMVNEPTFPGCGIDVRPIGLFRMRDRDEMDEKVLCVPAHDPLYTGYLSLADVPKHFLLEVEHFFTVYKDLEGHRVQSLGWEDRDAALSTISDALTRYTLKQRREEIIRLAQTEVPREGLEL